MEFSFLPNSIVNNVSNAKDYDSPYSFLAFIQYQNFKTKDVNQIMAFPQPADGSITFNSPKMQSFITYTIFDNAGKVIETCKSFSSLTNDINIDINTYHAGLYLISFRDFNGETIQKTFIVQH
jgi:hypothetical protein